jgi:PPK2 family polyphosphate:nucleotide phosphotransferase
LMEFKMAHIPTVSPIVVKPGTRVQLGLIDPEGPTTISKDTAKHLIEKLKDKLGDLQTRLYAEGKQALLIVLQAMDAGGKDGTIKNVFRGVNPQGVTVTSFKVPTPAELSRDFLWRIHQAVPPKGMIGIFNRSHYEDVLVARVAGLVPEVVWRRRYDHINAFERLLVESGTRILKFYLHIGRDEQKERLDDRLASPDEQWKFSAGDLPVRAQWDDYMRAYEDAMLECSTEAAPWHVVPANRKWLRNLYVTQTIVDTLQAMDPRYPPPADGLDQIVVPD